MSARSGRLGLAPRAPVELQSVVEEECGGNGALACARRPHSRRRGHHRAHRRSDPALSGRRALVRVRVTGRPAHAGDAPEGQNAIEATFPIISVARARGRAERRAAGTLQCLSAPDQPQRRPDSGATGPRPWQARASPTSGLHSIPARRWMTCEAGSRRRSRRLSQRPRPRRPRGRGDLRRLRV